MNVINWLWQTRKLRQKRLLVQSLASGVFVLCKGLDRFVGIVLLSYTQTLLFAGSSTYYRQLPRRRGEGICKVAVLLYQDSVNYSCPLSRLSSYHLLEIPESTTTQNWSESNRADVQTLVSWRSVHSYLHLNSTNWHPGIEICSLRIVRMACLHLFFHY